MSTLLSTRLDEEIAYLMKIGDFTDAEEVVGEALQLLKERELRRRLDQALDEADEDVREGRLYDHSPELWADIRRQAIEDIEAGIEIEPDPNVWP
jgi:hypothetical protein